MGYQVADFLAGLFDDGAAACLPPSSAAADDRPEARLGPTLTLNPTDWRPVPGGLVRRDLGPAECPPWEACPQPGDGCPSCGSLESWEDLAGRRRCGQCEAEALDEALALAGDAARLRRHNPAPMKSTAQDRAGRGQVGKDDARIRWRPAAVSGAFQGRGGA
jgi:hypothetical protein